MSEQAQAGNVGAARAADPSVPDRLVGFGPGEGLPLAMGPFLRGRAEWTAGAYCITDQVIPPRFFAPIHRHAHESQVVLVVSGRVGFYVEGSDEIELPGGSYAYRPAGLMHALWNPTDEPAHVIELTSPGAGFQAYMLAVSELMATGRGSREAVQARAREAGIEFSDAQQDELCARHGVSPSAAFWR
ncbi:cupin domain-containing protein [Conexibacter sp. CPCC 206217]|uniref:cupin domain-containing protein n=1 Tax=Conexibacter sp. CPCC 206217 TaxID=3064574 RepID=UPI0027200445|nr:cupin domain-containing protein [Conexibacter sp. CPCC 206217]MDO8210136.1 cupin domain-containing protein [Conexibacter sp. CPCC 206217]